MQGTVLAHFTESGSHHARSFPNIGDACSFLLCQNRARLFAVTAIRIEIRVVAERGDDLQGAAWSHALNSALTEEDTPCRAKRSSCLPGT
jgi:hypothetical protein